MILSQVKVENFRSIDNSGDVKIDADVTVLVGQNESGKTAFLKALDKSNSVVVGQTFDVTEDYPRKNLTAYQRRHSTKPDRVASFEFILNKSELAAINKDFGFELLKEFSFGFDLDYASKRSLTFDIEEVPAIKNLAGKANLPEELKTTIAGAKSIREVLNMLGHVTVTPEAKLLLTQLTEKFAPAETTWENLVEWRVWKHYLVPKLPKFFYFDDYYLLPGKVNLQTLLSRVTTPSLLSEEDKTVLSLLRMAGVTIEELNRAQGYEEIKARLEGLSNSITDRIFKYWTQNKNLHVEFDIRADPHDKPPFNSGPNLYIRIRNNRHRVSTPFSQRSKGFVWFFSFIVWFDTVREQNPNIQLILLLDEPGLNLHAVAQADLLRYIDDLSPNHQIIYTTHSPFMVHSDKLYRARLVEDNPEKGTTVSDNLTGGNPSSLFPLQAALGYTLAQNLFISKRILLVEGPADLVYNRFFSVLLESQGQESLRDEITLVPAGGLDKVATFVALLGANQLEMAIVHDYAGKPDARLESLVREKLIQEKRVLNYAMFRDIQPLVETDVEDLIDTALYLQFFNATFQSKLAKPIAVGDLPPGNRIVQRLTDYLNSNNISLRPSGGYNHYLVANHMAANPPKTVDAGTLKRFAELFRAVNQLFTSNS
jgi:predicted ATPase